MAGPFFFAWCGGAIQEQTTLVTNGNTHGGVIETFTVVGDATGNQIINLADTSGFEADGFYRIDGPGGSAFFIYDTSVLSGQPGSLALTNSVGNANSVTLKVTRAIPVGAVAGQLSAGSNVVILGNIDLPAGWYGIQGTGIADTSYTQSFSGTTTGSTTVTMVVGSAFFQYDGSSGSAQMLYVVANQFTHTGQDSVGNETSSTTYGVVVQPANATASGQFGMTITGMPDQDWSSITSIPNGVLASLQPGLRYNITGNGIQVGTTFVNPGSGTAIEIDQPASTAQLNAILTITGPRTPDAAFDPTIHDRFDCDVLEIEIAQQEGNFATLTIKMRASAASIGLLAVGRNLWCWLSWDQNWTPAGGAPMSLVPLFNGRLVGVPKLQATEIIELEFLARPDDFNGQKTALGQSLSVLPYYDPVWLAANVNLDTVLESYSALWHIDRTSLAVTTTDFLQGEDGAISIDESTSLYEHFSLSYNEPPLVAVTVSGTVTWPQEADGYLDVTNNIAAAFAAQGAPGVSYFPKPHGDIGPGGGALISCLCGDGLASDWPKPGTSIGGGWTLSSLNDGAGYPLCYIWNAVRPTGWLNPLGYQVVFSAQAPAGGAGSNVNVDVPVSGSIPSSPSGMVPGWGGGFNLGENSNSGSFNIGQNSAGLLGAYNTYTFLFPLNVYKIRMVLRYEADRKRTETVSAVLAADVQSLLSDSSEQDRESVALTSDYVSQGVDPGGEVPIGNLSYRSYFQSDRGARSFEYILLTARAKMRARARAVDITFAVPWRNAIGITLRNSVTLLDRRLPGGTATGKVKSYTLTVADGQMFGEFTIGCSIGAGNPATAQSGTNSYVDDGYVDAPYQVITGAQSMLLTDELAYETLDDFAIDDDGLDLNNLTTGNALNFVVVQNGVTTQLQALQPYNYQVGNVADPVQAMRTFATQVTLDMKPVAGSEFHTNFFPAVSPLALPKTIDLSATDAGGAILRAALAAAPSRWDYGRGLSVWDGGATVWDQPND